MPFPSISFAFTLLLFHINIKNDFIFVDSLQYVTPKQYGTLNPTINNHRRRPAIISHITSINYHPKDTSTSKLNPFCKSCSCGSTSLYSRSDDINEAFVSTDDNIDSNEEKLKSLQQSETTENESSTLISSSTTDDKKSFFSRLGLWTSKKNQKKDTVPFKTKLRKAGLAVLLSYGFVSNMSYSVSVSLAWYGFNKQTGLSPLAPGQWKGFLAVYAGFYVFNNFVRPARFTLSVGVSKYFDSATIWVEEKFKVSKSVAIGILVFLANFCGTLAAMSFGIWLASIASGVAIFPPKA